MAELAFHLVNLAICINPARIAVGGGMAGSWARLQPDLERALNAGAPFPPQLVLAEFPHEAPLIGAVALAVDAAQRPATTRSTWQLTSMAIGGHHPHGWRGTAHDPASSLISTSKG